MLYVLCNTYVVGGSAHQQLAWVSVSAGLFRKPLFSLGSSKVALWVKQGSLCDSRTKSLYSMDTVIFSLGDRSFTWPFSGSHICILSHLIREV